MHLRWLRLDGYRRFQSSQTIKLDSKLVALVGPNEAGKTSILQSIEHLTHDNVFQRGELTRGYKPPGAVLVGAFFLDDQDRKLISDLPGGESVRWLYVSKSDNTRREYEVQPAIKRDLGPRIKVIRQMSRVVRYPKFTEDSESILASLRELIADLKEKEAEQTLTSPTLASISEMVVTLHDYLPSQVPAYVAGLPGALTELVEIERRQHPSQEAVARLRDRILPVALFNEESRNLLSTYDLQEVHADPRLALRNLTDVAGLDLVALHRAVAIGDQAEVNTHQTQANRRLAEVFPREWNQSRVKVEFRIDGYDLHVQIQNEVGQFSTLAERSDGLRQFIALMAFCLQRSIDSPLLLIDEAETHLHYDAQADMVNMLARQLVARQVIYSTHSMGCLPEDLGAGVRLVKPHPEEPSSTISNRFWSEKEPGFSPLIFGMGATALAFFPVRDAVLVEGPSDMILLPTVFRELSDRDSLGFQIVHGLSEASRHQIPILARHGARVVYLTDNDGGGRDLQEFLLNSGVAREDIFSIATKNSNVQQMEDLVNGNVLVKAVNQYIRQWHSAPEGLFRNEDLPPSARHSAIRCWCENNGITGPPKVDLAYAVLDVLSDRPDLSAIEPARAQAGRNLLKRLQRRLAVLAENKEAVPTVVEGS